jgi:Na+-transporting methylmalonyl-CoA/oxaloacetate decarboxylase gamma subunit
MVDWGLALKIFTFGLSAVFGSLAILIAAIYAFGRIIRNIEGNSNEKG